MILTIVGLPARQEAPRGTHASQAWEVRPIDGTELEQSVVRHLSRQASPVHWPTTFLGDGGFCVSPYPLAFQP